MFPNQLTLCTNKRLKNEEDTTIITQLKMNCLKIKYVIIIIVKYINKYVFDKLVFKNKYNDSQISIYTEEKKKIPWMMDKMI